MSSGVLVFEGEQSADSQVQETLGDVLVFDAKSGGETLVEEPAQQDFLLVDAAPTPAQLVQDTGETELLVLTAGGPPGPAGTSGPTGPIGPAGQDGAGVYYQTFGFASPSTLWTIVHNRNTFALNVETVDGAGEPIEGNVRFVDANTIQVDWYYPTAGEARVFR